MTRARRHAAKAAALLAVLFFACAAGAGGTVLDLRVSCGLPDTDGADRNLTRGTFHGRKAMRFYLDADDAGMCPADIRRGNYNRAELRSGSLPLDRKIRIRFDVFIPTGFPATGGVAVGQFHQRSAQPLVLLFASDKGYRAAPGSGLRALSPTITHRDWLFRSDRYGTWRHITMEALFSHTPNGFIRVYADDRLAFESKGATVRTEPYFKVGIYARRDRIAGPLTVYVTAPTLTVD